MRVVRAFLWYALASIGWEVRPEIDNALVATDLHGKRWRITVTAE